MRGGVICDSAVVPVWEGGCARGRVCAIDGEMEEGEWKKWKTEVDDGRRKTEDGERAGRLTSLYVRSGGEFSLARELAGRSLAVCLCGSGRLLASSSRSFGLAPAAHSYLGQPASTRIRTRWRARVCQSLYQPRGMRGTGGVVRDRIAVSGVSGGSDRASCNYI